MFREESAAIKSDRSILNSSKEIRVSPLNATYRRTDQTDEMDRQINKKTDCQTEGQMNG